jgi:hypothetical protein
MVRAPDLSEIMPAMGVRNVSTIPAENVAAIRR